VIAKELYRKLRKALTFAIRQAAARLSPSGGTTFQTTLSPLSFGESFMKIRSTVPENGCLIGLVDENKQKKQKKTKKTAKHIRIRLLPEGGCVNYVWLLSAQNLSDRQIWRRCPKPRPNFYDLKFSVRRF